MTLAQMRTALQARGYGTDTATTQTELLNAAYREIVGKHHWPFLEDVSAAGTTTAGSMLVTSFPISEVMHLREVRLFIGATGETYDLEYLPHNEFNALSWDEGWEVTTERAVPRYWTVRNMGANAVLAVGPVADRVYTVKVWYYEDPADLSADGDIPVIPPTYHDIIVEGALAEMAARHRDWAQHDRYRQRYETGILRMKSQLGLRQQQSPGQVRKSGFFDDEPAYPWMV